jgi:hypothetical protein
MGELVVDFVPQMLEMVLERRRNEVQAHRDRVMALYQIPIHSTTAVEFAPILRLAFTKRDG